MGVGMHPATNCPTVLAINEMDRLQSTCRRQSLYLPMPPAVFRVQDNTAIADGPSALGVDKAHVVESRVLP